MKCTHLLSWALVCYGALLPGGCATSSGGGGAVSGEDSVRATLAQWESAMESQQVDAALACYSTEFQSVEWGNHDGVRSAIEQARVVGYLDGMQIDVSAAQVSCDNGLCRAAPIRLIGSFGEDVLALTFKEETGAARIVGSERLDAAPVAAP